ncbi:tautomerase family protein [Ideonella livida]|uniref:4-oxalocrotonate tautomerase n=1 Tax=Ideonella livida TaxID=2707176 RepID=A0A7C9PEX6_9BURK|nr:4-oxalocrotonate tautomerase [Ideonella livida]NDY90193.1 4-oxalocrotonate tautomerase [Ideonella livida]
MPLLNVLLSPVPALEGPAAQRLCQSVASDLLAHTVDHLHKRADLTAIVVQLVPAQQWFIAGRPLPELGQPSAAVEIRVTDDTNTDAEKAAWLAAVQASLGHHLPGLHEVSYLQVQDLHPAAWGYGGRTQAARRARAQGL